MVPLCELEYGISPSKHFITTCQKIVIINANIYDVHSMNDTLQNHVMHSLHNLQMVG